ncbi:MAG: hypothetical protein ACTSPY_09330 [Candidatus Helarchaeota archaeon]
MTDNNSSNEIKCKPKRKRTDVFKESGSSRVIASASWTILMAVIGAIMLFTYQIIAGNFYGGTGGLSYFSVTGAILALTVSISVGCGQAFIKFAKEKYTTSGIKEGNEIVIQMTKINLLFGIIISIIMMIISFLNLSDPVFFIILLGATSGVFISFIRDILMNMMGTLNRFDLGAIVGGLFGVVVCIFGFLIIFLNLPAEFLSFIPTIMTGLMFIIAAIFYNRIKTVGFKDLFFSFRKHPINRKFADKYIKYGTQCAISNLVTFGIYSHIALLMTYICYNYWGSILGISPPVTVLSITQILTLIDSFVFIEVAIIFFAGPINVEISEACAKNDYDTIESSINSVGRISMIIALPISLAMMVLAPKLIQLFALGSVSVGSPPVISNSLFFQAWVTLAITSIGQALYGLAQIYGSALIGAGKAKTSAIAFGIGALILLLTTPMFIFLLGFIDNFLPISGINNYALTGTGFAFLISGLFVLPYLASRTKQYFKIKFDLRLKRMIVPLLIVSLFLFFMPIDSFALILQNLYPIGFEIYQILVMIFILLVGTFLNMALLCFFGVIGKGDGKILRDTFTSFKLGWMAGIFIIIGKFFYNLNPFNKK